MRIIQSLISKFDWLGRKIFEEANVVNVNRILWIMDDDKSRNEFTYLIKRYKNQLANEENEIWSIVILRDYYRYDISSYVWVF